MVRELGDVWRRYGERVVVVDNADCGSHVYAWADEVITWPKDPGHNGLEQCRRHLRCAEVAAGLPGVTALLEGDAFVTRDDFEVLPDVFYGSRLWDAWSFRDVKNPVCRWFVHPPYVADQPTWGKIAEVLRWWLKSGRICDDGHSDRVLCIAAQAAQVRVVGIGWSRNTVTDKDAASLTEALAAGVPLIHGVKDVRYVAGWLLQQKRE